MKKKWSRRKFLETGLKSSVVASGARLAGFVPLSALATKPARAAAPAVFTGAERETLRAAMDEIVPAADAMPAASEVGGVEYLERVAGEDAEVRAQLRMSLTTLAELSKKEEGAPFSKLSRQQRVKMLRALEARKPASLFATLRDFTYEAYYTNPRVWKLIGYEFHATNHAGPAMKPFDETVLANVRKRGKLYREVS
jgi:hypothetical protein